MSFEIENFFGCYILYSLNEKRRGGTYIGFTNDPNRRIRQHNKGKAHGGARRTNGRGPWEMVLIVHGFPNEISALRFEWAWQNPEKSVRLKRFVPKTKKYGLNFKLDVLMHMLQIGPWNRLPLTVRWLRPEYSKEMNLYPPKHMPIVYGPVKTLKLVKENEIEVEDNDFVEKCSICANDINVSDRVTCIMCCSNFHILCLAAAFLEKESSNVLPVSGSCTICNAEMLWGDVIRFKNGCYQNLNPLQAH